MRSFTIHFLFISTLLISSLCYNEDVEVNKPVEPIEIAAIGRVSKLGGLYDARTDQFIPFCLFKSSLDNSSITTTSNRETKLQYTLVDSLQEKFQVIDVSAELQMSILSGLFKLQGSGQYFKNTKKSARSARASLIQSFSTVYEEVSVTDEDMKSFVNLNVLEQIDATHVVVGIQWGGRVLISVEDTNFEDKDKQEIEGNLGVKMKLLFLTASGKGRVNITDAERKELSRFNFKIFGDILPNTVPTNLIEAIAFMKEAPSMVKDANNGKGKAIKYRLIPISLLRKLWKINTSVDTILRHIEEETVQKCVELFDNMNLIEQRLNDIVEDVKQFKPHLDTRKVEKVMDLQSNYGLYQSRLRTSLSDHLLLIRSGNETVNKLEEVIFHSTSDSFSWKNVDTKINELDSLQSEIAFLKMLKKLNVTLVGKTITFQQFLWNNFHKDMYILFYDYNQANNVDKYMNQFMTMLGSREDYGPAAFFAAANLEILRKETTRTNETKISLYRNGKCYIDKYELGFKPDNDSNPQLWSLFEIQNKLSGQIKETSVLQTQFNNHESTIKDLKQNPIPINFTYVQLSSQPDPRSLWPTVVWEDVTSKYSGLFFRAEGSNAAAFGAIQEGNAPRLTKVQNSCNYYHWHMGQSWSLQTDSWTPEISTGGYTGQSCNLQFYISSGEVRPRNTAIRIWKRIR